MGIVGHHPQALESGPLAAVRLPDGQTVQAIVLRRIKDRDGSWWYQLTVSLWARVETRNGSGDRLSGEPAPTEFLAPAHAVSPIDGHEYSSVATWRHPATLRRDHRNPLRRPRPDGRELPWDDDYSPDADFGV
ncbi:hypothetical protein C8250_021710 [Streptomyces sp. So13.3]|uniref:hypothetical protein n=1 Tax=Streptomyces sp. So13.3 TaxID=2136173 RepID=UPI00110753ED|nr:hypothetical protein [Streptomyces sp. So13.3]QNA74177.1 hypothetical protein C8250_021710 [Streptomyces sp. So13.3]